MKTTLDIDEDLLIEAEFVAAKRNTTLNVLLEDALRRELSFIPSGPNPDPAKFERGPLGFFVLKRKPGEKIDLEQIQALRREIDAEDFRKALHHQTD